MALDLRELVIRATITDEKAAMAAGTGNSDGATTTNEDIINLCVEKVMEILKEKNGR